MNEGMTAASRKLDRRCLEAHLRGETMAGIGRAIGCSTTRVDQRIRREKRSIFWALHHAREDLAREILLNVLITQEADKMYVELAEGCRPLEIPYSWMYEPSLPKIARSLL